MRKFKLADRSKIKGFTVKKLYDANGNPKKLFQWNFLGRFINKRFGRDLKIPFITGVYTYDGTVDNLVVTRGKQIIAEQLNGVTTAPVTAIAIGSGNTAPAAGNTALVTEITTNGGQRGAATCTSQTTTTTKDTAQWVKTFTFSGSLTIEEEGLFDNNTSGGNLLARQTFSAINVVNTDTLQITHKIQFS
jgi:hypothetical protein